MFIVRSPRFTGIQKNASRPSQQFTLPVGVIHYRTDPSWWSERLRDWPPVLQTPPARLKKLLFLPHTDTHACARSLSPLVSLINSLRAWQGGVQQRVRPANSEAMPGQTLLMTRCASLERLTDQDELRSQPHLSDGKGGERRQQRRQSGHRRRVKNAAQVRETRNQRDGLTRQMIPSPRCPPHSHDRRLKWWHGRIISILIFNNISKRVLSVSRAYHRATDMRFWSAIRTIFLSGFCK